MLIGKSLIAQHGMAWHGMASLGDVVIVVVLVEETFLLSRCNYQYGRASCLLKLNGLSHPPLLSVRDQGRSRQGILDPLCRQEQANLTGISACTSVSEGPQPTTELIWQPEATGNEEAENKIYVEDCNSNQEGGKVLTLSSLLQNRNQRTILSWKELPTSCHLTSVLQQGKLSLRRAKHLWLQHRQS